MRSWTHHTAADFASFLGCIILVATDFWGAYEAKARDLNILGSTRQGTGRMV